MCEHFKLGKCTRGEKCRFVHEQGAAGADATAAKFKRAGLESRRKLKDWQAWGTGELQQAKGDDDAAAPACAAHQLSCVRRTVDKPSARWHGRAFYSCRFWQNREKNCGFFRWVDAGPPPPPPLPAAAAARPPPAPADGASPAPAVRASKGEEAKAEKKAKKKKRKELEGADSRVSDEPQKMKKKRKPSAEAANGDGKPPKKKKKAKDLES